MTMFRKLNFWPFPKTPGGRDPKNCAGACAIHVSNSQTKSGWISGKKFFYPPQYPKVPPLGMTQVTEWKSRLICHRSFICEKIHKVWLKNLWNWLCYWYLTFWPSPQALGGRDPKNCAGACAIYVSNSHTKSGWISGKKKSLQALGGRDPKNCAGACAIHVSISHTKSGWISKRKKKLTLPPHTRYPQVPPLAHDPGGQMKIQSDMFYIFHLWEDTQSLV